MKFLFPLKAKYKISLEVAKEEGDELTFLKRKHVFISKDQLAIQSHPKHLEKLFEHLKLNKKLAPKKTPGHVLLDEPDRSEELNGVDSKTFRSCVGILLYIGSDYLECQLTIRALSQFMSRPTKHAMMCLCHLAQYLLGCVDHCVVLTYKGHQGMLRYTPEDYTLEVYSDSDWAKHRGSRKSVSSGFLCLFGTVLYSRSRSQKALALSSAEVEISAATGACCDGVLLCRCLCFVLGGGVTVKFTVNMDNSAGRAFLLRSGVGRIRHISVRVLWMQQKVKEQMIQRLTYLFRLCFTRVLADLNVPKTILAHRLQSSALSCICFQKKKQQMNLLFTVGSPSCFAWLGRLQKKNKNKQPNLMFSRIFHTFFRHFPFVIANSLSPADVWPWRATDLPRGAGCTHTSEPVHTSAKFPL